MVPKEVLAIQAELTELLGPITIKKLFTGYGIFSDKYMFGIICNSRFYLRAEDKLAHYLHAKGARNWVENCKMKLAINNYYLITDNLKEDKNEYQKLLISSIQQVRFNKLKILINNKERIKFLPNLSVKHERLLAKIHIYSIEEFCNLGAEVVFARLKEQNPNNITVKIYWQLLGALKDKHPDTFTSIEKTNAMKKLNVVLLNMGLKTINISRYLN